MGATETRTDAPAAVAAWIRASKADQQRDVLRRVRRAFIKKAEDRGWTQRFDAIVEAGGYETAALMIVEHALPGIWWVIAKGKRSAEEPIYGAQLHFGQQVIALDEHDEASSFAILLAMLKAVGA